MAVIYGVVLFVMLVMNGALFFVLRTAAAAARRQAQACFVRELEGYSGYIEEKQAENRQIEEEKEKLKKEVGDLESVVLSLKSSPFYAPRPIARELFIPEARYIDNEFFDDHKIVNDMLQDMDYREIVEDIAEKHRYQGNLEKYKLSLTALKILSLGTAYEICTLDAETQKEVCSVLLRENGHELFEEFCGALSGGEEFDVLNFRTFLREIRTTHDPTMYIRIGRKNLSEIPKKPGMVYQYDANISEGIKIIYQNQSYDFSIYRLRKESERKLATQKGGSRPQAERHGEPEGAKI